MDTRQTIIIEESGDAGFKFNRGSSRFFVIALVIFANNIDAEYAESSIQMLKQDFGWHQNREFKFNKTNREQRVAFLRLASTLDFTIRAVLVDKERLVEQESLRNKNGFYLYVIERILNRNADAFNKAFIFLDGEGDRTYRQAATVLIRRAINKSDRKLQSFSFVDSKLNHLVQLADMIAGSINRSTSEEKADHNVYLPIIQNKIVELWRYPDDISEDKK